MPTPITHVVLTEEIFDDYFIEKDKKTFYIGTCFPDIRRTAKIPRSQTHLKSLILPDAMTEKSFMAGFKFHSILDPLRAKYFRQNNLYGLIPESKYIIHASKVFEDSLVYNNIDNWHEFIDYLDDILKEEIDFGIKKEVVKKWHISLQDYFSQKPNENSIDGLFKNVGYSQEVCDEINKTFKEIHNCEEFKEQLNNFHMKFKEILKTYV